MSEYPLSQLLVSCGHLFHIITHPFLVTCNCSQSPLVSRHSHTIKRMCSRFVLTHVNVPRSNGAKVPSGKSACSSCVPAFLRILILLPTSQLFYQEQNGHGQLSTEMFIVTSHCTCLHLFFASKALILFILLPPVIVFLWQCSSSSVQSVSHDQFYSFATSCVYTGTAFTTGLTTPSNLLTAFFLSHTSNAPAKAQWSAWSLNFLVRKNKRIVIFEPNNSLPPDIICSFLTHQ